MSATALRPPVDPADRFALTLCLAIIVHVMVVLGVSFAPEPRPAPRPQGLEVTLVSQRADRPPEQADALAQANLRGGGDDAQPSRPSAPIATPLPATTPAVAVTPPPAALAPTPPLEPDVPRKAAAQPRTPAPPRDASRAAPPPARLTQPTPAPAVAEAPAAPDPAPSPPTESDTDAAQPASSTPASLPSAAQLITRSFALASLNAELQQKLDTHAKRPRQKFISANTQEYRYAAYMEAWRAKVERIGNINYPDEARQKQLSGALLLDVSLRPDGTVIEILVRRSSGHKVLDDAAVRIVELAAPFAPFPDDIAREVDVLHVTRTWKFLNTAEFAAQ